MKFSKTSKRTFAFLKKNWPEFAFAVILFSFSWWLMWHTFNYQDGVIYIATKAWSDFGAHIPLIRSFSWGRNFPPEYPIFPGEPIRYHFLFYALVGILERSGLPIDWALNIPSAFSFFALLLSIYLLAKLLFKDQLVAVLGVILFLSNGSLSFLEFFKNHPLSLKTPIDIFQNTNFPSFGPYDGKTVSAFWNLNIYTNQRHLAGAFALILLTVFFILKPLLKEKNISTTRALLGGFVLSLFPFFHSAGFVMSVAVFGILFILLKNQRKSLLILIITALVLGSPQILFLQGSGATRNFRFRPGYLMANNLTSLSFIHYWLLNFGLASFLIPLGFIKANSLAKKVLLAFSPLFIIGNLFQFSPEIAANHKFFNLFLILGNMFVAYAICLIWQKKIWGKMFASILIFFLILSGIIDFFAIKNDSFMTISDLPKNPDVAWIKGNTPPDAVFLNSSYLYHPASLAGRKIFLGWPYFAWSVGYDTNRRDRLMKKILDPTDLKTLCNLLSQNRIEYLVIEDLENNRDFEINFSFFEENFKKIYTNQKNKLKIFEVKPSCNKIF